MVDIGTSLSGIGDIRKDGGEREQGDSVPHSWDSELYTHNILMIQHKLDNVKNQELKYLICCHEALV